MHAGERPVAEQAEVALELARRPDAGLDFGRARIPERACLGLEQDAAALV